jgi:hypothetical protein
LRAVVVAVTGTLVVVVLVGIGQAQELQEQTLALSHPYHLHPQRTTQLRSAGEVLDYLLAQEILQGITVQIVYSRPSHPQVEAQVATVLHRRLASLVVLVVVVL